MTDAGATDEPREAAAEPLGALLRRAARRAVALVLFGLAFSAVTWLPLGRHRGGEGVGPGVLVPLLTCAGALVALAALARPVQPTPVRLAAQHLALGLAGTAGGLVVLAQAAQLHALERGADPVAAWSAALSELGRLTQSWSGTDAVVACAAPVGAAAATLLFSGGRQGCGWALLVPVPGLSLLAALGHLHGQGALLFGLFCTVGAIPWLVLFQLAEPRPRSLSGGVG